MRASLHPISTNLLSDRRPEHKISTAHILKSILSKIPPSDQSPIIKSLLSQDIQVPSTILRGAKRHMTQLVIPNHNFLLPSSVPSYIPNRNNTRKLTHTFISSKPVEYRKQRNKTKTLIEDIRYGDQYYSLDEPEYVYSHPDLETSMRTFYEIPYPETLLVSVPIHKIYITGIKGANDSTLIRMYGIYAVLTVGDFNDPSHSHLVKGGYMKIPLNDAKDTKFKSYVDTARKLLDNMLQKGNVLVHDYGGISRACALVASYFIRKYGLELEESISLIKTHKPEMDISEELMKQLKCIRLKSPE